MVVARGAVPNTPSVWALVCSGCPCVGMCVSACARLSLRVYPVFVFCVYLLLVCGERSDGEGSIQLWEGPLS